MENNALAYHLSKVVSELEVRIAHRVVSVLSEQFQLMKEASSNDEKLMTDDDVCRYLQISSSSFYKLKKRYKNFPEIRFQSTVRYRKSDVELFLSSINK